MPKSYTKRKDGRYMAQITYGVKRNGEPKKKSLYGRTITELDKKVREFKQLLDKGIVIDDMMLTVADWSYKWLEIYKNNVSYNTKVMYKGVLDKHIVPEIGHIRLKDLKTYQIQTLINKKVDEGLTRTVEKIRLTMNQLIKQAIINEFIYKDIMQGVTMPRRYRREKRALTSDELATIMKSDLPLKEKTFILTLIYTGLRRGEILALTAGDIDLTKRCVTVNKSVYFKVNQPVVRNKVKTTAGMRTIPLPGYLCEYLAKYVASLNDTLILFPSRKGTVMSLSVYKRFWANMITKLERETSINGLKVFNVDSDITAHVCRHTYATMLYDSKVDVKTAQSYLGHATIGVTLDIYTHLDEQRDITSRSKIDNYIDMQIQNICQH